MVNYKCYRCGKDFSQKCHILNHLVRKNTCKSILKEIDNEEILRLNKIEEYNKNKYNVSQMSVKMADDVSQISVKKEYKCKYCEKKYKHRQSKFKHEKKCEKNKNDNLVNKILEENKELKNELNEIKDLLKVNKTTIKGNNNVNNNNTTNNIQINNFDCETVEYFSEKLALRIAKHYGTMVGRFIEHLHFNKEHPENHTIKINDAKSGLGQILVDGTEKSYIMDDFLEEVSHNLKDKLYELNQVVPEERQEEFEILYDEAMDFIEKLKNDKKVKRRIKAACINGTNSIHKEDI